jgi:CDP-diacylglycerol--glycerol-3-phosphate 3-phosphatidyltransferase
MNSVSQSGRSQALNLPNLLTYGRVAAVPVVSALLFWPHDDRARWLALAIFVAAGITDYLDGYFARAYAQHSTLGRMLDPIADKLLVSSCLLMLAADGTIRGWSLWAAIVILCREILVSGLREYLIELRVSLPVTRLAKWKTTAQLTAVGFLLAGDAGDLLFAALFGAAPVPIVTNIGLTLLWLSALVTLYTGYDYFTAGVRHLIKD